VGWHKLRLELCFRARLQPCRKRGNLNEGFSPRGMFFTNIRRVPPVPGIWGPGIEATGGLA
jgi:hypothetical protein